MLLATSNAQGELSALERGLHALHSGLDGKAYAASVGKPQQSVAREICAARVIEIVPDIGYDKIADRFSQLVEIHAASTWLWSSLVTAMLAKGWTVEQTRGQVARLGIGRRGLFEPAQTRLAAVAARTLRLGTTVNNVDGDFLVRLRLSCPSIRIVRSATPALAGPVIGREQFDIARDEPACAAAAFRFSGSFAKKSEASFSFGMASFTG